MKYLLFALLLSYQTSFGQSDTTLYFKDIGWSIKVPAELKISAEVVASENKKGEARLVETKADGRLDTTKPDQSVTLIHASKNQSNLFYSNYIISSKITSGTWESFDSATKEHLFTSVNKQVSAESMVSFSNVNIDGISFRNQREDFINGQHVFFTACFLSTFYKHRYLMIVYFFNEKMIGQEIDDMLKNSKFDKSAGI
jgi:hypothetical protein